MAKTSQENHSSQQTQLLTAAKMCFARNGIHATSMEDVCDEAEVSTEFIYRYFDSKNHLIDALVEQWDTHVVDTFKFVAEDSDPFRALNTVLDCLLKWVQNEAIHELQISVHFWSEAAQDSRIRAIQGKRLDHFSTLLGQVVERCQEQGSVDRRLDPKSVAQMILTWFQGLMVQRVAAPDADFSGYENVIKAVMAGEFVKSSP